MDYEDPSRAPKKTLKKAPTINLKGHTGIKAGKFNHKRICTKKGKVIYLRRKKYMTWRDVDRIARNVDPIVSFPVALGAHTDDLKDYYAILDLWMLLTSFVEGMHLELPIYLDALLSAQPASGWKTTIQRALRDRIVDYLTSQYRDVIIELAKEYFDLFKGIKDFQIEDTSLSTFVK